MKIKLLFITLLLSTLGFAQKGTISGVITDKDLNNETLPFANITVKGTTTAVQTNIDGKYSIDLKPGNYILVYSFLGYESQEENVTLSAGENKKINKALSSGSVTLEDVVIESVQSREKETALLLEQKNAVEIKQSIGAQELSRKGVSDAEGAVTKVTGISKQEGERNVFVRGLGDRYNSTTLNGLPLPSENPQFKNITLDFFTSDIIKSVGVNKTFSSEIYGDVGGANIDILSKELSGNQGFEIGMSTGANTQTLDKDFLRIDGSTWYGYTDKNSNVNNLSNYSFKNSLNTDKQSLQLNSGLAFSGGRKFDIGDNTLSVYLVGTISNKYNYREGNIKQTTSTGTVFLDQDFEKYVYNVSQTLMGNFKYKFGNKNSISLNTLYIHDNTQDIGEYFGLNGGEQEGDMEFLRRQQTNDNNLLVNQLLSEIRITDRIDLKAGVAFNMTNGNEPDRRSNNFLFRNGSFQPSTNSAGENERYFSELKENDYAGNAVFSYKLSKDDETRSKIDFGYNFRNTKRDFSALIFNHRYLPPYLTEVDIYDVDAIFNQDNLNNGVFQLQTGRGTASNPRAFVPFTYNGEKTIHAGLASLTYEFNPNFTAVIGARFEKVLQEVEYDTNIANSTTDGIAKIDESYILPNLNIKYNLSDNSIIRAAGSMSYTLPQFIEVAPFKYQDISYSIQGNPNLLPSENYNFDLKWEYYLESDEIIALTGFYKHIDNPIARSEIPSGGNTLTFLNVGGQATVTGLELEIKKNIFKIETPETNKETALAFGLNISYLNSKQDLDNPLPQFTNAGEGDELQGASPLLGNADITFRKSNDNYSWTSSLVMNYFSDRIFSIGTRGYENIIEKGIPTLDFVTQTSLGKNFGISLKAKNLLNPDFKLTRESAGNSSEDIVLSSYKRGIDISLGLTYKF